MPKGIRYTDEFKWEAVKLVQVSGKSVKQISTELGIKYKTLTYWVRSSMLLAQEANPKQLHHYQDLLAEN
ncbi:MAG: hypothetical protein EOP45_20305 [Sphingobacteriaceae bacterium]|nr:MAG: hypothetical protein EOP45_20305 [Sphingobacteriaceae bacterium]